MLNEIRNHNKKNVSVFIILTQGYSKVFSEYSTAYIVYKMANPRASTQSYTEHAKLNLYLANKKKHKAYLKLRIKKNSIKESTFNPYPSTSQNRTQDLKSGPSFSLTSAQPPDLWVGWHQAVLMLSLKQSKILRGRLPLFEVNTCMCLTSINSIGLDFSPEHFTKPVTSEYMVIISEIMCNLSLFKANNGTL